MKKLIFFALVLCFVSCSKDEIETNTTEKTALIGKWDAYYSIWDDGQENIGRQYSVLMNYEHGFEIVANGHYYSRYVNDSNDPNSKFETSLTSGGTWKLEENKLTFYSKDKDNGQLIFTILNLDHEELIFKNEFGLSTYLRKTK